MDILPSRARHARLTGQEKCGPAYVVHIADRRSGGFVAAAGSGVIELTKDRTRARGFATAAEARRAVDLGLGLGVIGFRVDIISIGGQQ